MEDNGGILSRTKVLIKVDVNRNGWLKRKEGVIKAKKQTESKTLDHWHARGGVLLSKD